MNEKTANTIQQIINTLNQVTVSGYDNMNKMLGCMQTLHRIKNELTASAEAEKAESEG